MVAAQNHPQEDFPSLCLWCQRLSSSIGASSALAYGNGLPQITSWVQEGTGPSSSQPHQGQHRS